MAKISVIVPVYKVEQYLNRCVDSILNQTYKDFELILVDDGSPDNSPKICDEYAIKNSRVHVIHKENGGLSDARNFGIDYALTTDSEWITFIDSDDWVHCQYLEILYNSVIENNVLISSCGFQKVNTFVDDEKINLLNIELKKDTAENLLFDINKYELFNFSVAWGRLYKKELWKDIRFPFGRFHEDEFTTYKLLFAVDNVVCVLKELYYYYTNPNGIMESQLTIKRVKDILDSRQEKVEYVFKKNFFIKEYFLEQYLGIIFLLKRKVKEQRLNLIIKSYYKNYLRFFRKNKKNIKKNYYKQLKEQVKRNKFKFIYRIINKIKKTMRKINGKD